MERLGGFANCSPEWLAERAKTSVRTARRWIRQDLAPRVAVAFLKLVTDGALETIHSAWKDWTVRRDGKLHAPNGWTFTPAELIAIPLRYQLISELRAQLAQYQQHDQAREHLQRHVVPPRPRDDDDFFEITVRVHRSSLAALRLDHASALGEPIALAELAGSRAPAHVSACLSGIETPASLSMQD